MPRNIYLIYIYNILKKICVTKYSNILKISITRNANFLSLSSFSSFSSHLISFCLIFVVKDSLNKKFGNQIE